MTQIEIKKKNAARAKRGLAAIKAYAGKEWGRMDTPEHMQDLLCDLMHYAEYHCRDFDARLDSARGTFEHELKHGEAI